ncbi:MULTISPECIES: HAMP domain-containing sensor histidine kinase [Rhodococcus]|uniref:Signal transduction histidine-protein kinase/phosphatase MprB n=1 Tax=Rhodococcus aetherivorans TaxID=191292 RepID=N1MAX2_9NOCA|nr:MULTISPECIES: HAMP domain-containing sensor histidine kinase [Rhodococcus]ETT24835.1 putative sensor with HAMP domain containing protein [Rhodococcus rhodochrous ATCC 21198]AKE90701.1 ATPase [Rhodococcus aetherivorans]ANZ24550.1 ATPase [Rhodococcus sp. WB1]MBC2588334.1 HAMP domain-containing histidine kinase [Rhodococcus aetherivorans]MDV6294940.1 HAMP domain-containing sensor histidine kinase [Rhodococcus aetherivorans]
MRRRILFAVLAGSLLVALLLGVPLAYTAWLFVEDTARRDLQDRLDRMSAEIIAQEGADGLVVGGLDTSSLRLVVPDGGRLLVVYPTPEDAAARLDIGAAAVPNPLVESLSMGTSGSLRLEAPSEDMRLLQRQVLVGVTLLVLLSMAVGAVVAVVTARRLADPLRDVAARARRLAEGDFRPDPRRHGIPELDRVSDVLDAATVEIAGRLQREHALVGDVSHQLRSRLTAVRLRLDELSTHADPAVVEEAEEAMRQVDRLTTAIDELVRASRNSGSELRTEVSVVGELAGVIADWRGPYKEAGRELLLSGDPSLRSRVTGSRLREAVAVLVDNALMHGGGTCTVSVRRVSTHGGGSTVCVEVTDEGDGVSDELAPHIFDRGFSGTGSTGVGLALARALTEADGGRLELQRRRPALFALFLGSTRDESAPAGIREPR